MVVVIEQEGVWVPVAPRLCPGCHRATRNYRRMRMPGMGAEPLTTCGECRAGFPDGQWGDGVALAEGT